MFGNFGKMMKLASELKTKLPEMKERLASTEYPAEAGGGAVGATVNGRLEIVDLRINPDLLADETVDAEMLADLVRAAVAAAQARAAEAAQQAMLELTGGMDLGGMGSLLE